MLNAYRSVLLLVGALLSLGLAFPVITNWMYQPQQEFESPYLRTDPEKIVLSARDDRVPCGECHTLEYDQWKSTPHSTGFDTMHRSPQAQSILERMDFKLSKRESLCLRCHYTANIQREQARAIAGVSCESCHGAGRDWVEVHNDYNGATHDTETAQNKQQRLAASDAGGMLRPSDNVYGVVANCFECHTVPEEDLINVGRHPSGSKFELVEWSDNIRHNFLQAQWSSDESNREATPERKRQLYVIGRILDYEYSIRGAANATEQGSFSKAMERRVASAYRELEKIARTATIAQVNAILQLHSRVKLTPNNGSALLAVADAIREQGQAFGAAHDGSELAAVDNLLRGGGGSDTEEPASESSAPNTGDPAAGTNPSAAGSAEAAAPVAASVNVQGERRSKPAWFQPEQHQVTVPGCNCHATAEDWLFGDPHGRSADPIAGESSRALEIATLYGLSRSQMKAGNQICMQCHGTIEHGTGSGQVFESVGCESCHGPASGYLQPHKRGQGFQNGLKDLNTASVRAANCAQCHHITDERLLASGHSSGQGYDIVAGNNSIRHWPDPDLDRPAKAELDGGALRSAFNSITGQRPVPSVEVARLPASAIPAAGPGTNRSARSSGARSTSTAPRPPRPRPLGGAPLPAAGAPLDLPPLPEVNDSTSTEELLLLIKQRLELIYQTLGRDG